MTMSFRSGIVLVAAALLAGSMCFAEDGAAIFKSKCAMCHGPAGTPSAGMAKMLGIKPVSDPAMKAVTVAQVEAAVKNGQRQDEARCRADRRPGEGRGRVFQDLEVGTGISRAA